MYHNCLSEFKLGVNFSMFQIVFHYVAQVGLELPISCLTFQDDKPALPHLTRNYVFFHAMRCNENINTE
jgi:hypothetical protein